MSGARDLLWDYALRTLTPELRREVEAELSGSPELRAELAELTDLAGVLPLSLPPVAPAPAVKQRLLKSIAARDPFAPWLEKVALLLDLSLEHAKALLERLHDPAAWRPSGLDGLSVMFVKGGP